MFWTLVRPSADMISLYFRLNCVIKWNTVLPLYWLVGLFFKGTIFTQCFQRDHSQVLFCTFRLSLKQSHGKKMLLYSVRGQQLCNHILVRIHLNLIRGTWPRINNHSAHFVVWKSRYITILQVVIKKVTRQGKILQLTDCDNYSIFWNVINGIEISLLW